MRKWLNRFPAVLLITAAFLIPHSLLNAEDSVQSSVFNVRTFGARGDGGTLDTRAIQAAFDACGKAGGGTVFFPSGTYVSGTLRMGGRTTLHLDAGAVLSASRDTSHYGYQFAYGLMSLSSFGVSGSGAGRRTGLIVVKDAEDVAITGQGTLDGNGDSFFDFRNPHKGMDFDPRLTRQGELFLNPKYGLTEGPFLAYAGWDDRPGTLVIFWNCRRVRLNDITIRNAPNWAVHFQNCDDINVSGISIENSPLLPNDDGIDVYDSRNVRISGCRLSAGDDCIAVIGSENVTVSNCVMKSRSAGIRIGYGSRDVRNCTFQNVVIDTSNRGIGIFVRGKGSVENVFFSDVIIRTRLSNGHWWGKGEPVHISILPYGGSESGHVRTVRFSNMTAEGENGLVLYGCKEGMIEDVGFDKVLLRIGPGANNDLIGGNFDLRPSESMESSIFKHGIPGIFGRFIRGLTIRDSELQWTNDSSDVFTHGIECENVSDLSLDGFVGRQAPASGSSAAVSLNACEGVSIRDCRAAEGTTIFLLHSNLVNSGLFIGNDLRNSRKALVPAKSGFKLVGNRMP
jgi:hypothetical protein